MSAIQKSTYGSVKPYTRHISSCEFANAKDHNPAGVPSGYRSAMARARKNAIPPSWAEASRIAAEKLRGMDPEIAAARASNEKQTSELILVSDAWQMWQDRTERKFGKEGVYPQYKSLKKVFEAGPKSRGSIMCRR